MEDFHGERRDVGLPRFGPERGRLTVGVMTARLSEKRNGKPFYFPADRVSWRWRVTERRPARLHMPSKRDESAVDPLRPEGRHHEGFREALNGDAETPPSRQTADLPPDAASYAGPARPAVGPRYEIEKLHRSGGLGRVWLVRDEVIGRTVALKDLRPERSRDSGSRGRFVEEARITGQLQHPSIVPLYDLIDGPDGPCYTMRFVAGRTLAEAARAYHDARLAGKADRLSLTALLDAFVSVCQALAYAHNRNVLHRDLKGQNVVVGNFGEVFVLDWGLAKLSSDPITLDELAAVTPNPFGSRDETGSGDLVGTPAFAAPEIARIEAATKSTDVYGLGAVLYQILTGRAPYEGTYTVIVDELLKGPPPPPRSVNPDCPPALDAICRKAMSREPAGRYASPEAMAADVRRWLADEPVEVYPEPFVGRALRWARRHRAAVFGSFAVLATAIVGLLATIVVMHQGERRTAEERDHAQQEWTRAEDNLKRTRILALQLIDISDRKLPSVPQADAARQQMTDAGLKAFQAALAQRPNDPVGLEEMARAYRYSANLHRQLDHYAVAEPRYREAVAILSSLHAERPEEPAYRGLLAENLRDQAQVFSKLGRLREAVAGGRRAAKLVEDLLRTEPGRPDHQRTLATGLIDLSGYEYIRGEMADSEASAHRSADLFRAIVDKTSSPEPLDELRLSMALHRQAIALREIDKPEESLAVSKDALARLPKSPAFRDNADHFRGRIFVEQAKVLSNKPDRRPQALNELGQAIRRWDDLRQRFPERSMYLEWQAAAFEVRGRIHLASGAESMPEADKDLDNARRLLEKLILDTPEVPVYRTLLGRTYLTLGRLESARGNRISATASFVRARDCFKSALGRSPDSHADLEGLRAIEAELP
jgi:serine/threonine-protein kinase